MARFGEERCADRFEEGPIDDCCFAIDCSANLCERSSYRFVNTADRTGHPVVVVPVIITVCSILVIAVSVTAVVRSPSVVVAVAVVVAAVVVVTALTIQGSWLLVIPIPVGLTLVLL